MTMTIEKKMIRSDIPGHQPYLAGVPVYGSDETRRMIVGKGITLNGTIAACDHLVIDGTVEAAAFSARRMDVLENGLFTGTAEVVDAIITGRFEGTLVVTGRLIVRATGRLFGDISYGTIEAENGARIEGRVASLAVAPVVAAEPAKIEKAPAMKTPILKQQAPFSNIETLYVAPEAAVETEEEAGDDEQRPRVFRRAVGF
jgi:cytoskeletal protein CcmA (bactofilin family)